MKYTANEAAADSLKARAAINVERAETFLKIIKEKASSGGELSYSQNFEYFEQIFVDQLVSILITNGFDVHLSDNNHNTHYTLHVNWLKNAQKRMAGRL